MKINIENVHGGSNQDKNHDKGNNKKPNISYGVTGHGDDSLGNGDAHTIGIANGLIGLLFRNDTTEADGAETLVGIVVTKGGILGENVIKGEVSAAVTDGGENLIGSRLGIDVTADERTQRRDELTGLGRRDGIGTDDCDKRSEKAGNAPDEAPLETTPDTKGKDDQQCKVENEF